MPVVEIPANVLDRLQRYMGTSWTNVPDAITSIIDEIEEYEDCDGAVRDDARCEPEIDYNDYD